MVATNRADQAIKRIQSSSNAARAAVADLDNPEELKAFLNHGYAVAIGRIPDVAFDAVRGQTATMAAKDIQASLSGQGLTSRDVFTPELWQKDF